VVRKKIIFFILFFSLNLFSKTEELLLPDLIVEDTDLSRFGKLDEINILEKKFSKNYFIEEEDKLFSLSPFKNPKQDNFYFLNSQIGSLKDYDFSIGYEKRENNFLGGYLRFLKKPEIFNYQKSLRDSAFFLYKRDNLNASFSVLKFSNKIPFTGSLFNKEFYSFETYIVLSGIYLNFNFNSGKLMYSTENQYKNLTVSLKKDFDFLNFDIKTFSEKWSSLKSKNIIPLILNIKKGFDKFSIKTTLYTYPAVKFKMGFNYELKIRNRRIVLDFFPYIDYFDFKKKFLYVENFVFNKYPGTSEVYPIKLKIFVKDFVLFSEFRYVKNYIYPFEILNSYSEYKKEPKFNNILFGFRYYKKLRDGFGLRIALNKYVNSKNLPFTYSYKGYFKINKKIRDFYFEIFLDYRSKTKSDLSYFISSYKNFGFNVVLNKGAVNFKIGVENLLKEKIYYQRFYGFDKILFKISFNLMF